MGKPPLRASPHGALARAKLPSSSPHSPKASKREVIDQTIRTSLDLIDQIQSIRSMVSESSSGGSGSSQATSSGNEEASAATSFKQVRASPPASAGSGASDDAAQPLPLPPTPMPTPPRGSPARFAAGNPASPRAEQVASASSKVRERSALRRVVEAPAAAVAAAGPTYRIQEGVVTVGGAFYLLGISLEGVPDSLKEEKVLSAGIESTTSSALRKLSALKVIVQAKKNLAAREILAMKCRYAELRGQLRDAVRTEARVIPQQAAWGVEKTRWLPGSTSKTASKNRHAHKPFTSGRHAASQRSASPWEGSQFEKSLMQNIIQKLFVKFHFHCWKQRNAIINEANSFVTFLNAEQTRELQKKCFAGFIETLHFRGTQAGVADRHHRVVLNAKAAAALDAWSLWARQKGGFAKAHALFAQRYDNALASASLVHWLVYMYDSALKGLRHWMALSWRRGSTRVRYFLHWREHVQDVVEQRDWPGLGDGSGAATEDSGLLVAAIRRHLKQLGTRMHNVRHSVRTLHKTRSKLLPKRRFTFKPSIEIQQASSILKKTGGMRTQLRSQRWASHDKGAREDRSASQSIQRSSPSISEDRARSEQIPGSTSNNRRTPGSTGSKQTSRTASSSSRRTPDSTRSERAAGVIRPSGSSVERVGAMSPEEASARYSKEMRKPEEEQDEASMLACVVQGMSVEAAVAYMQEKLESGELKGAAAAMVERVASMAPEEVGQYLGEMAKADADRDHASVLACEVSGMSAEAAVAYMQEKLESGELKGAAAAMVERVASMAPEEAGQYLGEMAKAEGARDVEVTFLTEEDFGRAAEVYASTLAIGLDYVSGTSSAKLLYKRNLAKKAVAGFKHACQHRSNLFAKAVVHFQTSIVLKYVMRWCSHKYVLEATAWTHFTKESYAKFFGAWYRYTKRMLLLALDSGLRRAVGGLRRAAHRTSVEGQGQVRQLAPPAAPRLHGPSGDGPTEEGPAVVEGPHRGAGGKGPESPEGPLPGLERPPGLLV